jgi:hypothetical protein
MEDFLQKIFTHNNQSFLFFIFFIFKDFSKMKYDIEFSISINIITHIYLSITSLLSQADSDIVSKKFFVFILKYFLDNLLKDLISLRSSYLCFGKQNEKLKNLLKIDSPDKIKNKQNSKEKKNKKNKKNKNKKNKENNDDIEMDQGNKDNIINKEEKCTCFSCVFNTIDMNKSFKCGKCDIKTNLRLQLIDPNKDDDLTVCGFCNINDYFKSFSNIFENEDKLELIKTNDNVFAQYSKYSKSFKSNKKNKKEKHKKMLKNESNEKIKNKKN